MTPELHAALTSGNFWGACLTSTFLGGFAIYLFFDMVQRRSPWFALLALFLVIFAITLLVLTLIPALVPNAI